MSVGTAIEGPSRQNISRGLVALLKQQLGRGPTSARTFINDDVVTVVLQDTLTAAEKTLIESDRAEVVSDMRRSYQDAICDEAVALIERETGRNVMVMLSDHSVIPDCAVECFVLEPLSGESSAEDTPCEDRRQQESDE